MPVPTKSDVATNLVEQGIDISDADSAARSVLDQCSSWESRLRSTAMRGALGAPDWLDFEMRIWTLGELLRLMLKKKKNWRGHPSIMCVAANILQRPVFGKGRQTFALLLGDNGDATHGGALGHALRDPDVRGHALKALAQLRIRGFEDQAREIAEEDGGWIRSAAKRYLSMTKTGSD